MLFNQHGFQVGDDAHLPAVETIKDPASLNGFFTEVAGYKVLKWARVPSPPWVPRRRVVLLDRQQGIAPYDGRRYAVAVHYAWDSIARSGIAYQELTSAERELIDRVDSICTTDAAQAAQRSRLALKPNLDSPIDARVREALATEGLYFATDDERPALCLRVPMPPGLPIEVRAKRVRPGITPRSWRIRSTDPY